MGTKISYIVDRRQTKRRQVRFPVELRAVGTDEDFLLEYAHNISEHGIFLATRDPLDNGTVLELVFPLPQEDAARLDKKTLRLTGEVVWINPTRSDGEEQHPGMGIQFQEISDEDLAVLERMIHRIAVVPEGVE